MDRETICAVIEHAPVRAYLFEVSNGDYLLAAVNAAVRAQHPEVVALYGRPQAALYADQPQTLLDARRAVSERGVVVREMPFRRFDQLEANQTLRLTYTFVPERFLLIYSEDVSPPAGAEAALRESEERYRSLVASSPDGIVLRGRDGKVLTCNEAAAHLFGRSSVAELIGCSRLAPPGNHVEDESGRRMALSELPGASVVSTGQPVLGKVFAQVAPGGGRRWLRVSSQPVRDVLGALTGTVTTFTDETDRVNAQRALQESAARLDLALDTARMGTWEWDPTCGKGYWSENLYHIFHLAQAGTNLPGFLEHVHPEDRPRVAELSARLSTASDGFTFEEDWRMIGDDGQTRWARFGGRGFGHGDHVRHAGTVMDRTERRRLEDELLSARRLESLGRLAGGVAHDFNNLLSAMLGSLELIDDGVPPEARDDLQTARHAAERARDLTRQLLAFARQQVIKQEVVDLSNLVATVERMLQRLVGRQLRLQVESGQPVHVLVDATQIEQVLVNLVVNARDATPAGGVIGVRVSSVEVGPGNEVPAGAYAELRVWDTGAGMDEKTLSHAFDPFFTTKDSGTGLGLASCYGVVQQHRGHISVKSAPREGTTFRILLPRVAAPATSAVETFAKRGEAGQGCILLIDDDALVRSATKRSLQSLGYEVLVAGGGNEAVQVLSRGPHVDAVVCDVVMPDQSGPQVIGRLARMRPGLKVMYVSGFPAEELGGDEIGAMLLQKPFTRAELASAIEQLLGRGRDRAKSLAAAGRPDLG